MKDVTQMSLQELREDSEACQRYADNSENKRRFPHRITDALRRLEVVQEETFLQFDTIGNHLYACYNDGSFPVFFTHVVLPDVLTIFPDSDNEWFIGALRIIDNESAISPRSKSGRIYGPGDGTTIA